MGNFIGGRYDQWEDFIGRDRSSTVLHLWSKRPVVNGSGYRSTCVVNRGFCGAEFTMER